LNAPTRMYLQLRPQSRGAVPAPPYHSCDPYQGIRDRQVALLSEDAIITKAIARPAGPSQSPRPLLDSPWDCHVALRHAQGFLAMVFAPDQVEPRPTRSNKLLPLDRTRAVAAPDPFNPSHGRRALHLRTPANCYPWGGYWSVAFRLSTRTRRSARLLSWPLRRSDITVICLTLRSPLRLSPSLLL
jgi:hypothetical protein